MVREDALKKLLCQDVARNPNLLLLKKFLLTVHYGWFRINNLPPDAQFTLGSYLLDDERVVIDFTRMSELARDKFLHWFLNPHKPHAQQQLLSGVTVNNYRGYTAEVGLSWWGRIINYLFYRKKSYFWSFTPHASSLLHQVTGMEICQDTLGLLIGFKPFGFLDKEGKYRDLQDNQIEPLRNVKRVYLTDAMVNNLIMSDLKSQDFASIIDTPHPFAVKVISQNKRLLDMKEYRQSQRLISTKFWLFKFWGWFKKLFVKAEDNIELDEIYPGSKHYSLLFAEKDVKVLQRQDIGQVVVTEKRPEIDSLVFCGGGVKIFAHVGALKAFEDSGGKASHFAGSSSGAIMAVLCYLGYSSHEILNYIRGYNQDNLIHYDIDSTGLSDARALKAGLDYMILKKVNEIIDRYRIEKTAEGRKFLNRILKSGKITFESLLLLRKQYPDCGLGKSLIVTATNIEERKTKYFAYSTTPQMEISEAVKMSASFPIVFKPTVIDGHRHNDGGVLNNFPTEVFMGDLSTLLESEFGNCLSLMAFQFDHGNERRLLDKLVDRVYRENFVWNLILSVLTGVKDPASGWERDRLKLLQYSHQVVLLPVGSISTTQFNLSSLEQNTLVKSGYDAGRNYIQIRGTPKKEIFKVKNKELMYSTFTSLEELLYFCCYRGHTEWFERVAKEILKTSKTIAETKINDLRNKYFQEKEVESPNPLELKEKFKLLKGISDKQWILRNLQLFALIYPVFHKIFPKLFTNSKDLNFFKKARHFLSLQQPLAGLKYLREIKGKTHVLLYIFIQFMNQASLSPLKELTLMMEQLEKALAHESQLKEAVYYDFWDLLPRDAKRILRLVNQKKWSEVAFLCESLKNNTEPLSILSKHGASEKDSEVFSMGEADKRIRPSLF